MKDLEKVFSDIFSITKKTGSLWIVADTFTKKVKDACLQNYKSRELVPLVFDIIRYARSSNWKLRDILIWQKDKTLPWSRRGQLRSIFEYILFFTKTDAYKFFINRVREPDPTRFKDWWVKYRNFDVNVRTWPLGRYPDYFYNFFHSSQDYPWGDNSPGINDTDLDTLLETIRYSLVYEEKHTG